MAFDFSIFGIGQLEENYVDWLINQQAIEQILHYEKLWNYYRNEMREISSVSNYRHGWESSRPYQQNQEYGLPPRITGMNYHFLGGDITGVEADGINRKEVVIENDIAWRVDTLVDFLFGKPITIVSQAQDPERAEEIQNILKTVFDNNGGMRCFQELALLGCIYGFVDIILRFDENLRNSNKASSKKLNDVLSSVNNIFLEIIEAPRCVPILNENNYRKTDFYIQHFWRQHNRLKDDEKLTTTINRQGHPVGSQKQSHHVEIINRDYWQRYEDGELIGEGVNPIGIIPVVHIQNMPLPRYYEGQSDIEPLIPLQDELNTRLSDRANRITFQSFKMYLGKGIEGFENRVIAPGRMWSTENPDAEIKEFGGDPGSPSEEIHIAQIREAIDKASGVASVAAGILKGRVGNLTSAVALKVTLMGILAKTERKRLSYGKGVSDICRLILVALNNTGIYKTTPQEREIQIHWPSPLPENLMEKLQEASLKKELGISRDQILKELGYGEQQN